MAAPLTTALTREVVNAVRQHSATVIFVHGLGDSGAGWEPVAEQLKVDEGLGHVKWILPNAPVMSVTANFGMSMPSWFDIIDFSRKSPEDEAGMLKTARSLNEIISEEIDNGIPASRIVLGGFSQGGAMSLLTGLTSERKLAGLAVMSGWVPLREKFKAMATDHARTIPIFWGHGKEDPLITYGLATASKQLLQKELGVKEATEDNVNGLEFHGYDGLEHSAHPEELNDLRVWLKKVIKA